MVSPCFLSPKVPGTNGATSPLVPGTFGDEYTLQPLLHYIWGISLPPPGNSRVRPWSHALPELELS
jgi:hypothetical protein